MSFHLLLVTDCRIAGYSDITKQKDDRDAISSITRAVVDRLWTPLEVKLALSV